MPQALRLIGNSLFIPSDLLLLGSPGWSDGEHGLVRTLRSRVGFRALPTQGAGLLVLYPHGSLSACLLPSRPVFLPLFPPQSPLLRTVAWLSRVGCNRCRAQTLGVTC